MLHALPLERREAASNELRLKTTTTPHPQSAPRLRLAEAEDEREEDIMKTQTVVFRRFIYDVWSDKNYIKWSRWDGMTGHNLGGGSDRGLLPSKVIQALRTTPDGKQSNAGVEHLVDMSIPDMPTPTAYLPLTHHRASATHAIRVEWIKQIEAGTLSAKVERAIIEALPQYFD